METRPTKPLLLSLVRGIRSSTTLFGPPKHCQILTRVVARGQYQEANQRRVVTEALPICGTITIPLQHPSLCIATS